MFLKCELNIGTNIISIGEEFPSYSPCAHAVVVVCRQSWVASWESHYYNINMWLLSVFAWETRDLSAEIGQKLVKIY